jgi:integrase
MMASIKKRPDGKWRARYRDEEGRERARHFDRKIDATNWLAQKQTEVATGTHVDPDAGKVTLRSFYGEWAPRQVWATNTATAMELAVRSCTFADTELRKVRRSHVESWVKQMSVSLQPGTIRTRVNNVRSVLRAAARDRVIAQDPSAGVVLPRLRRAEHAMRIPSPEEVGQVLRAATADFAPFVALCAFAGLRLGETAAVQVNDIDFLRRKLHVQRQVQRANGGLIELTPPKHGSERAVFLPDELLQLLSTHVAIGTYGDEGWLFTGGAGLPPHQNTVGHRWRRALKTAQVEPFRLHDLRHFYASGLIAQGCDVVTVQRALGHAKATTTLSTYSHLWPSAEDRTRTAAGALMQTALRNSGPTDVRSTYSVTSPSSL